MVPSLTVVEKSDPMESGIIRLLLIIISRMYEPSFHSFPFSLTFDSPLCGRLIRCGGPQSSSRDMQLSAPEPRRHFRDPCERPCCREAFHLKPVRLRLSRFPFQRSNHGTVPHLPVKLAQGPRQQVLFCCADGPCA